MQRPLLAAVGRISLPDAQPPSALRFSRRLRSCGQSARCEIQPRATWEAGAVTVSISARGNRGSRPGSHPKPTARACRRQECVHPGQNPSCGRRAVHRRGLSVPPRPGPARPGPARWAARGGGGAGRGDSAGGVKRRAGAGAAAAATCAAANKVGRDARCARAAARWREGCCPRCRGDLSSRSPHDLTQSSVPLRSSVSPTG